MRNFVCNFLPMVLKLKIERFFNNREFENPHDIEDLKIFSTFLISTRKQK